MGARHVRSCLCACLCVCANHATMARPRAAAAHACPPKSSGIADAHSKISGTARAAAQRGQRHSESSGTAEQQQHWRARISGTPSHESCAAARPACIIVLPNYCTCPHLAFSARETASWLSTGASTSQCWAPANFQGLSHTTESHPDALALHAAARGTPQLPRAFKRAPVA